MSGNSYTGTCPKCGSETDVYCDWKPFDSIDVRCHDCGWYAYTAEGQMTLEEVNEERADCSMEELTELKKQTEDG